MSIEVTRLDNGVTVATDRMPEIGTAAVNVVIRAGARWEAPAEHGLAHLLEHMAFKGTGTRSARRIVEEIEEVGGDLNASTGVEQTSYEARVLGRDVPLALDILADILTDPTFDGDELERERGVILQEIGAVEDTPDDLVYEILQEGAFAEQPLGRSVLGTPETLAGLGRQSLAGFRDRHYHGPDTVVTAAGAVAHRDIVSRAADLFGGLPAAPGPGVAASRWTGGDRRAVRDLEQAHIALAWPGRAFGDDQVFALQVFANALGGGMSSRLFQEVREARGLAYSVHAFHWAFSDAGMFGVYAGTGEEDVRELVDVVLGELGAAAATISESEVARARAQMRMALELAREQPQTRADRLARQILVFGRPVTAAEILARVDAVTVEDVRRAGAAALASRPAVAGVGPVEGLPTAERVAERLGSSGARAA